MRRKVSIGYKVHLLILRYKYYKTAPRDWGHLEGHSCAKVWNSDRDTLGLLTRLLFFWIVYGMIGFCANHLVHDYGKKVCQWFMDCMLKALWILVCVLVTIIRIVGFKLRDYVDLQNQQ